MGLLRVLPVSSGPRPLDTAEQSASWLFGSVSSSSPHELQLLFLPACPRRAACSAVALEFRRNTSGRVGRADFAWTVEHVLGIKLRPEMVGGGWGKAMGPVPERGMCVPARLPALPACLPACLRHQLQASHPYTPPL